MYSEPCAKLTIRVTPKMSESPAAIRNSVEADASPFRNWTRMLAMRGGVESALQNERGRMPRGIPPRGEPVHD